MRFPAGAEWIIILVIVLLLFGASRLPGLAQSVGKSMRIFKSEVKTKDDDGRSARDTTTGPGTTTAPGATTPGPLTSDDDGGRTHP